MMTTRFYYWKATIITSGHQAQGRRRRGEIMCSPYSLTGIGQATTTLAEELASRDDAIDASLMRADYQQHQLPASLRSTKGLWHKHHPFLLLSLFEGSSTTVRAHLATSVNWMSRRPMLHRADARTTAVAVLSSVSSRALSPSWISQGRRHIGYGV